MNVPDLEAIRGAYSRFLGQSAGRVLLTGHSHQAWPDAARDAMAAYFDDSARLVDDKWSEQVFPRVERVGRQALLRLGLDETDPVAFGRSTHELVYRLLSCLPPGASIVTTTGEFHSLDRQLRRLEEDGLAVRWTQASPRHGLAARLIDAIRPGVALVALSAVFFEDAFVLEHLASVVERAAAVGALCLVDAYHAFNVVPIDLGPLRDHLFVTAGGYKYGGWGEGACFLRVPPRCELRPRYTGWFADFGALDRTQGETVSYGGGGARFAGATFDASAIYRAAAVLETFDALGLDVETLRAVSTAQTTRIHAAFEEAGLDIVSSSDPARRGGFVAVRVRGASGVVARLRERGVYVDARGEVLRLGPAPYLADDEIGRGVAAAIEEIRR